MCVQVARGVAFMHSNGIVHGDVATHNCFVGDGPTVKLCGASPVPHCPRKAHGASSTVVKRMPIRHQHRKDCQSQPTSQSASQPASQPASLPACLKVLPNKLIRNLSRRHMPLLPNRPRATDFGLGRLAKPTHYAPTPDGQRLPLRWMSPESLLLSQLDKLSDAWGLGVCLWELLTYGGMPYSAISDVEVRGLLPWLLADGSVGLAARTSGRGKEREEGVGGGEGKDYQ